jgi:hypothetical protein
MIARCLKLVLQPAGSEFRWAYTNLLGLRDAQRMRNGLVFAWGVGA